MKREMARLDLSRELVNAILEVQMSRNRFEQELAGEDLDYCVELLAN